MKIENFKVNILKGSKEDCIFELVQKTESEIPTTLYGKLKRLFIKPKVRKKALASIKVKSGMTGTFTSTPDNEEKLIAEYIEIQKIVPEGYSETIENITKEHLLLLCKYSMELTLWAGKVVQKLQK